MDDQELAALRARRLAQLKAKHGQESSGGPDEDGGMSGSSEARQHAQAEEQRNSMLMALLDNKARERLSKIAIVRPPYARSIEDMLIGMARSGQIRSKVTEPQLIEMLSSIAGARQESKVVFCRRRSAEDDSDNDYGMPQKSKDNDSDSSDYGFNNNSKPKTSSSDDDDY